MIIATRQCGCPPKKKDPPCSPCCNFGEKVPIKPKGSCRPAKPLKSILSRPKDREPSCCPTKPSVKTEEAGTSKIHSEIAERGLPYKEIVAIINDNKVMIRTQKEPPKPEFEPPCECFDDSRPKISEDGAKSGRTSENRTLTFFPRQNDTSDSEETNSSEQSNESEPVPRSVEENPNIFRLTISKRSKNGQKIDVEFRTPRPWSKQMKLQHERYLSRLSKREKPEREELDRGRTRKRKRKRRTKKGKRARSEEITGRPPCGKRRKKDSVQC